MGSLPIMYYRKFPTLATSTDLADTATCNKAMELQSYDAIAAS